MLKINRSEIFKAAWKDYRYMKRITDKARFGYFLKKAWDNAKAEIARKIEEEEQNRIHRANMAAMEAAAANNPRIIEIDKELFLLEMIDIQSQKDKEQIRKLENERKAILMACIAA